jgi:di/tricarboxylate transporter
VSSNIAALFMTGAAQNLLAMNIARAMGVHIPDVWITWAAGAALPGLVSVAMIPALTYALSPPGKGMRYTQCLTAWIQDISTTSKHKMLHNG